MTRDLPKRAMFLSRNIARFAFQLFAVYNLTIVCLASKAAASCWIQIARNCIKLATDAPPKRSIILKV